MKFKKTSLLAAGALLSASLLLSGCGDDTPKVAYFNGERVLKESAQIEAIVKESEQKMKDLQAEAMKLATEGPEMTQEEIVKKQQEFQMRAQSINQSAGSRVREKVQNAIAEIQKTKKFDVVLENDKQNKTIVRGGVDLTDDLIEKLK